MTDKVICFLPCRAGSQRVVRKNIKPFAGFEHGLIEVKLRQLLAADRIDVVVLSTNDSYIQAYAETLNDPKLHLHQRVEELASSETSTDQLVKLALELIPKGHILWTHVTSPFITAKYYDQIIASYFEQLGNGYDSLMTTTAIHGFLWQDEQPINYDRRVEKWPRTQTLKPVHEVNSGAFLASTAIYRECDDRIGKHPYLHELDKLTSYDIDWPEDFMIAECIAKGYNPPPTSSLIIIWVKESREPSTLLAWCNGLSTGLRKRRDTACQLRRRVSNTWTGNRWSSSCVAL